MFNLFSMKNTFWPRVQLRDIGVLAGGVAVFVALALSTVNKFSIWFDEAFGSYLIRFDFWDMTRYTAHDVHPPLYYWLLKVWSLLFGNTELAIRSMSIFFGVVTLVLAFMLVMRLFGRKAAYISLVFLVLSPIFIRYSQEARMYTLLTTIIIAATYVLVYAQSAKKRWPWIVYGVLLAAGMLTQYFAALAWLSHWAWRAFIVRDSGGAFQKKFFTKDWLIAHGVAIAVFLPWMPWLIRQFADIQGNGFWIPPVTSVTIPNFLTNFLLFTEHSGTKSWLALIFYVLLALLIFFVVKILMKLRGEQRNSYLLIVCMVIIPVMILTVMSMPPLRPAFVDRYLMSTIIFLPILIGVSLVLIRAWVYRWLPVVFGLAAAGMMVIGIYNQGVLGNYNKTTKQSNNTRQLVEKVRAKTPSSVPIIASTPWIFYEAVVYSSSESPVYFADETTKYEFGSLRMLQENDDHKITNLDVFAAQHSSFWVISASKDGVINKIRADWPVKDIITVNDDVSGKPLFRAVLISAE